MNQDTNTEVSALPEQGTTEGTGEGTSQTSPPSMEQMMGYIGYLNQQVSLLQAMVGQTTPTPTGQTTAATNSMYRPSLKVAPPNDFDGTMSQTEAFLSQLHLFFHGKRIQDDQDRIVLALSYMKGGVAGPWAKMKVKSLENTQQTWVDFVAEVRMMFGDPDPASTARHKLSTLKQGSHTADEYVASFKEHQELTGYNDPALVEQFKKGLKAELFDQIFKLPQMPTNLKGWMDWATKLDRQWRKAEHERKLLGLTPIAPKSVKPPPFVPNPKPFIPAAAALKPPPAALPNSQSSVVPMEIDSGRRNAGHIICRKCRKPGHIERNCRSTYDINSMDFDQLKTFMKVELEKDKQVFEEGSGEGHVPEA